MNNQPCEISSANGSRRGYIPLSRAFFDGVLWGEECEYSRAEAWIDLIQMAAWQDGQRLVSGKAVALRRGEMIASLRFLGTRWQWSPMKVSRFVEWLKNETAITVETRQAETVISLCNYETYNPPSTQNETAARQARDKWKKVKKEKGKEIEEVEKTSVAIAPEMVAADGQAAAAAAKGKSSKGSVSQQTDEEFVAALKADPTLAGLDIDAEAAKARRWCAANRRQCSRRFFTNWVNRAISDRAMLLPLGGQPSGLQILNGGQQPAIRTREQIAHEHAHGTSPEQYAAGRATSLLARCARRVPALVPAAAPAA